MAEVLALSQRQAAKLLALGRDTIRELIRDGQLRTVDIAGRIRIPLEEVQRLAREGTTPIVRPVRAPKTRAEIIAEVKAR